MCNGLEVLSEFILYCEALQKQFPARKTGDANSMSLLSLHDVAPGK